MNDRAEGVPVAYPLFQAGGGGSTPTSALQLTLEQVDFADAKELNRLWHSRLPRFGTGFVKNQPFLSFGAEYDGRWYAAGIWSNPVARHCPQDVWLELRRLAISAAAPRNTASRMLTHNGETLCLAEWAEKVGLPSQTVLSRLNRGWSVGDALTRPVRKWPSQLARGGS